ncbi:MAG: hypothetical protein GXP53_03530 [Deltaproteobacteria bacterium]|nr:hypothetical protein [Deltaproteobacteria bacterium]
MDDSNKRGNTRSRVWPDTTATVKIKDPYDAEGRSVITIRGIVADLGSEGMFIKTDEAVAVPSRAEITIDFNPDRPGTICVHAMGQAVRSADNGIGLKFSTIDVQRLQKCILERMQLRN